MIETIIREFFPKFDPSPILTVRLLPGLDIRDAILWEYGLSELLPFAIDPALLDRQATDFIRRRGTIYSIRMALRWVGFPNITVNRISSFEYEVDPGRVPTASEISAIRAALSVSVQARGKLKRIYNGNYEVRFG